MPDLLTPLYGAPPENAARPGMERRASAAQRDPAADHGAPFAWPAPPFAAYAQAVALQRGETCEIVGLNDRAMQGRLALFVPEDGLVQIQLPPARTTMTLRFGQFKSLRLRSPVLPQPGAGAAPHPAHAIVLDHRPRTPYRVELAAGGELAGQTVGHVESDHGLYLFPPLDDAGSVERLFIPREAYRALQLGAPIGELLIAQRSATPAQIDAAVREQQALRSQRLGEILVTRKLLDPEQLLAAIEQQASMPMVRIGDALLSLGLVSREQLDAALAQQAADRSVPLGEILVRMGAVTREDLQSALARKMGYPLVGIAEFPAEAEAVRMLPFAMALRLRVMPLLVRGGRLIVALDDPAQRRDAIEEVEFVAQMKAVPVLAHCASFDGALRAAYDRLGLAASGSPLAGESGAFAGLDLDDTGKLVESLEREGSDRADEDQQIEQSDNSLVRLINHMIVEAWKDGASDIHVETQPGRERIRIRFRKDGVLRTHLELPCNYRNALIARIKIMCDLDIAERRKPQDGKINFARFSPRHRLELRVATIPTHHGLEDVVMRILASAKPMPLDAIGLSAANLERFRGAMQRPYGMVLCVGPTGSGKTTTLHSALSYINVPERKIWTAEDPIEITQPGLRQVQVNPRIDWTFAKALRAFLRADPDVIMVGEVRDTETAQVAIEASLTGHLLLSTLHTNSAPETVTRLLDMGMDPFNFADSLLAVLAQRLVRRLCPHCRGSRPATEAEIDELLDDHLHAGGAPAAGRDALRAQWAQRHGRDSRLMHHASPGCEHCAGSGYQGRVAIHELMIVDRELRQQIQAGERAEVLQRTALAAGMKTLRQDGIEKVLQGWTSIEEVRATSNV